MQHTTFGRATGLRVSELALGTGNFGSRWGFGTSPEEAGRIVDRFAEAGGTFLDTAESYQGGESEEILGQLLAGPRRERFTLATKFTNGVGPDAGVLGVGNGRRHMMRAVEGSLRRLQTDYIDLLWVHFPDTVTPVDEIVHGLDDLVRQGKVLYGGLSNFPAWRTARAATLAELRGLAPITAVQFEYSLVERTADREVLPMAEALGLGGALWSPLGGGMLTGKYRAGETGRLTEWKGLVQLEDAGRKSAVLDAVLRAADALGVPPAHVAVAWLRERAARSTTPLVPVIGPRTLAHLDDYLAALDLRLDPEHYRGLDEAGRVDLGQPHDLIATRRTALLGGEAVSFRSPLHPVS